MAHGLGNYFDVKDGRTADVVARILHGCLEFLEVVAHVALATQGLTVLGEVDNDAIAQQLLVILIRSAQEDGSVAVAAMLILQIFNTAPTLVVKDHDIDFGVFLDHRMQFGIQHNVAAVTDHGINFDIIFNRQGNTQRTVEVITHVGKAVFNVIRADIPGLQILCRSPGKLPAQTTTSWDGRNR